MQSYEYQRSAFCAFVCFSVAARPLQCEPAPSCRFHSPDSLLERNRDKNVLPDAQSRHLFATVGCLSRRPEAAFPARRPIRGGSPLAFAKCAQMVPLLGALCALSAAFAPLKPLSSILPLRLSSRGTAHVNTGLSLGSVPTHGPRLTASMTWNLLSPEMPAHELPRGGRLQLMKASLIAFICLNDSSDANGDATILTSVRNACTAMRQWSGELNVPSSVPALATPTTEQKLEHTIAILLHNAVASGRLSPADPDRVGCFGERTAKLVQLTAVADWQTAFHAAVYRALSSDDGWSAAMLLEARGHLLRDEDDVRLCREAVAWSDQSTAVSHELRANLESALRAAERRCDQRVRRRSAPVLAAAAGNSLKLQSRRRTSRAGDGCTMMTPPEEIECDVVIVGGGPAGCTCALYTSRANLKTVVLDKNPSVGALAITSHIANYPGVDVSMSGEALLDLMREQAIMYGTDYRRAQVFLVEVDGDTKTVYTPDITVKARALVLATGAMGRPPSYKGEDTYLGKGVSCQRMRTLASRPPCPTTAC